MCGERSGAPFEQTKGECEGVGHSMHGRGTWEGHLGVARCSEARRTHPGAHKYARPSPDTSEALHVAWLTSRVNLHSSSAGLRGPLRSTWASGPPLTCTAALWTPRRPDCAT
eukprot:663038-Prorocentrum_minimum.AAC.1